MSRYADAQIAAAALRTEQNIQRESLRPFRAVVTDVTGGLVSILRGGDAVDEDAGYPVLATGIPAVGDDVLCLAVGGAPLILGRLGPGSAPTVAKTAAAGSTATTAGQTGGNDHDGVIELIPGGTGITSGAVLTVTFAHARADTNYTVLLTPLTSAARTAGWAVGPTNRTTASWQLTSDSALTSGSTYRWSYAVRGF